MKTNWSLLLVPLLLGAAPLTPIQRIDKAKLLIDKNLARTVQDDKTLSEGLRVIGSVHYCISEKDGLEKLIVRHKSENKRVDQVFYFVSGQLIWTKESVATHVSHEEQVIYFDKGAAIQSTPLAAPEKVKAVLDDAQKYADITAMPDEVIDMLEIPASKM